MRRMISKLVRIGNSQGVRLPKAALEASELTGEIELEVRRRAIVIRPVQGPRADWAEEFQGMHSSGDDRLLDVARSSWDEAEWEW